MRGVLHVKPLPSGVLRKIGVRHCTRVLSGLVCVPILIVQFRPIGPAIFVFTQTYPDRYSDSLSKIEKLKYQLNMKQNHSETKFLKFKRRSRGLKEYSVKIYPSSMTKDWTKSCSSKFERLTRCP